MQDIMDYEEFKDYIKKEVVKFLPEEYEDAEVMIRDVVKNNGRHLDGLSILAPGETLSPTIYLNGFYESYQEGKPVEKIAGEVADLYVDGFYNRDEIKHQFDPEPLGDYEAMKGKIVCRLVNREANKERLADVPFTPMEDLAVTYYIMLLQGEEGMGVIQVDNDMLQRFGVDVETLHAAAMENNKTLTPPFVVSMQDVMVELMAENMGISVEEAKTFMRDSIPQEGEKFYCITNQNKLNGAAAILDEKVQREMSEIMGGDYYILPSSVHECLAVPVGRFVDKEGLEDMVRDVNATVVDPEERLSENVYAYDAKEHTLQLAEKYIERHPSLQEGQRYREAVPSLQVGEQQVRYGDNVTGQTIEAPKHGAKLH